MSKEEVEYLIENVNQGYLIRQINYTLKYVEKVEGNNIELEIFQVLPFELSIFKKYGTTITDDTEQVFRKYRLSLVQEFMALGLLSVLKKYD